MASSEELFDAISNNNAKRVRYLLGRGNIDINASNRNGSLPLLSAISQGRFDIVDILLEYGADIDILGQWDETPLMLAIEISIDMVRKFLNLGANINSINIFGSTPLSKALSDGKLDIAKLLILYGASE